MVVDSPILLPLILFLIIVSFGFLVSRSGRPYNPFLFNIHKLTALAGVVVAVLRLKSSFPLVDLPGWMVVILAAAASSVVMLFTTGGVMSIRKDESRISLIFHRAAPVIIVLCLIGVYFLL